MNIRHSDVFKDLEILFVVKLFTIYILQYNFLFYNITSAKVFIGYTLIKFFNYFCDRILFYLLNFYS